MNTHTTSSTAVRGDIGRLLRQGTNPQLWNAHDGSVLGRAMALWTVALWVLAAIVLISTGGWLVLVIGVVVYTASRKVRERLMATSPLLGIPTNGVSWLVPLSLLIPQLFSLPNSVEIGTASLWVAVACALMLLLEFSPWMKRFARHAKVSLGWSAALYNHVVSPSFIPQEYEAMSFHTSRERWERYQPELEQQLAGLPADWELFCGRNAADVIAVGSGGVVGIYSADFDGLIARSRGVVVNDQLISEASVALREESGYPVFGSQAWYASDYDPTIDIEFFNMQILGDAFAQESSLVDGEGTDFGFQTPTLPSKVSLTLASRLGMSADYSPVTVIVAHGLQMDTPWARVQVRDQVNWLGDAIICHPRYVADCVAALPGVFGSKQQIADAQAVVDLCTR